MRRAPSPARPSARPGRFEEADGGTLFLDELATLSSAAQDRLLRAIEYGEVTRIGSSRPLNVDVRIVAATNEHLPASGRGGPLPRRSARPAVVRGRHPAAAAQPDRATFRCSPTISRGAWRSSSNGPTGRASATPRHGAIAVLRLAGQCPRAAQRRRARGLSLGGSRAAGRDDPVRSVRIALAGAQRRA